MMKEFLKFKTWSTFAYLVPFAMAVHYRIWLTIIPLGLLILVCLEYHFSRERKLGRLDHILAWIVIFTNCIICYLGNFRMPFFGLAMLTVVISLFIYFRHGSKNDYNEMHGIWHITSGLITVFSIMTYLSSKY